MRYLIDTKDLDPQTELAVYRLALAWAATRGERFTLSLQPGVYDNLEDVERLYALGEVEPVVPSEASSDFLGRLLSKVFRRPEETVLVRGNINEAFVRELTRISAPDRAISGDVSPVEDVQALAGERVLYGVYDYGRDQVFDLTDEELESVREALEDAGIEPTILIAAPPYLTNNGLEM
ncbi:MAG TPA: hypothetical protein VF826_00140 [Chloroflexia bacterium]|jgi:hypothetical protein